MYTANILRKTVDLQLKKIYIDFAYHKDGGVEPVATETHEFGIDMTLDQIKRYAQNQMKRFEVADINMALITEGVIDFSTISDALPTQERQDKDKWFRNFNRLEQLTKLSTLGALRPALVTELDTLKTTVATDFKKAYIADM